jgi:uncharacterized protein
MLTKLVAGPVMALSLFAGAIAGEIEDGVAAFQRGDYATAMRLLRPLADQGNAKAQSKLGLMYENGQGVPQDYVQALFWYRKAAEQGDAFGQLYLGVMYQVGQGVPQDYAQALFWYRKAAEKGMAQVNLGAMYLNGQGVPQDYAQAHMWFNLAGSRAADAETRDRAVKNRDLVAAKMTPSQIAEAQRMAREWMPK